MSFEHESSAGRDMKVLALVSDAFGGHGGIATFNREFLTAIAPRTKRATVDVVPRLVVESPTNIPPQVNQYSQAADGVRRYLQVLARLLLHNEYDIIVCGHVHLLPVAMLSAIVSRCPLVLIVHGIEISQPNRPVLRWLSRRADYVVSVSEVTIQNFVDWCGRHPEHAYILPNCVDLGRFTAGPRTSSLIARYRLELASPILMTLGRLAGKERAKGFDEVIQTIPELITQYPHLVYLIVGDGPDRSRLERIVAAYGVENYVRFTGQIDESEKVDHYRLADLFVMPSKGEGFGIVILEALACGIPVIGSKSDGTREALANGRLGKLVNPDNIQEILEAMVELIESDAPIDRQILKSFSRHSFHERTQRIFDDILSCN